jgi:hypothetical protein
VSLLRRVSGAPQAKQDDIDLAQAERAEAEVEVNPKTPPTPRSYQPPPGRSDPGARSAKEQRAADRSSRMQNIREARKATSKMEAPEPKFGLYVAAFMVAVALISLFSTDAEQLTKKVGKTTQTYWHVLPQSQVTPVAIATIALVIASASTIYWRKRLVTMFAFMITAALSISLPLPRSMADLRWGLYLVPLGYAMWMFWRQNKAQKAVLAKTGGGSRSPGTSTNGAARRGQKASNQPEPRSRRKDQAAPVLAGGRPLPPSSGRYTRPQAKPRAGQRKR